MAEFRNIHTRIWKDEWFSDLDVDEKLLFIYLFSNERASVCGMFELPLKFIAFETGIALQRIKAIFQKFEKADKAYYRDGVVWVVNLKKYNDSGSSPKVESRFKKDLEDIPDCELKQMAYKHYGIPYRYPIDTLSEISSDTETETDTISGADAPSEDDVDPKTIAAAYGFRPENADPTPDFIPEDLRPLCRAFIEATNIRPVSREKGGWIKELRNQKAMGLQPADITRAVSKMHNDNLMITDIFSVTGVARGLKAHPSDVGPAAAVEM